METLIVIGFIVVVILFIYEVIFLVTVPKHLKKMADELHEIARVLDERRF